MNQHLLLKKMKIELKKNPGNMQEGSRRKGSQNGRRNASDRR